MGKGVTKDACREAREVRRVLWYPVRCPTSGLGGHPAEGRGIQGKRHPTKRGPRKTRGTPERKALGRGTPGEEKESRGSKGYPEEGQGIPRKDGTPPQGMSSRDPGTTLQPASTPFPAPGKLGYRRLRRGPRRVVRGAGQVGLAARAVRRHLPVLADPNASSERRRESALSARAALNPLLAAAAAQPRSPAAPSASRLPPASCAAPAS